MAAGAPSLEVRGRATRRPSDGATVAVGAVAVRADPMAEQPGVVAVGRLSVHSRSVYQREQPLIRIGCSGLSVSSGGGGGCNWSVRARVREVVVSVPGGRLTFRGVEAGAPNSWCPSSAGTGTAHVSAGGCRSVPRASRQAKAGTGASQPFSWSRFQAASICSLVNIRCLRQLHSCSRWVTTSMPSATSPRVVTQWTEASNSSP